MDEQNFQREETRGVREREELRMARGFCLEQLIWGRQQENMIGGKITFP